MMHEVMDRHVIFRFRTNESWSGFRSHSYRHLAPDPFLDLICDHIHIHSDPVNCVEWSLFDLIVGIDSIGFLLCFALKNKSILCPLLAHYFLGIFDDFG